MGCPCVNPARLAAVLMAGLAVGIALPVRAQPLDAPAGWTLGSLSPPAGVAGAFPAGAGPYAGAMPDRADRLFELHDRLRIGNSPLPSTTAPSVSFSPWIAGRSTVDGQPQASGGVLIDVPLGGFTFTPSVGAGITGRSLRQSDTTVEFSSQLTLGYDFENRSRLTLGYSHIRGGGDGRVDSDVLGFTFRLPFGALAGE